MVPAFLIGISRCTCAGTREGKFPFDKLVAQRFSLDQANEACDALRVGEILGRAIIEF